MTLTNPNNRLEVWGPDYINYPKRRDTCDIGAKVVQIEAILDCVDMFLVEVQDGE